MILRRQKIEDTVSLAKANIDAVDITTESESVPHQVGLAITVDVADEELVTAPAAAHRMILRRHKLEVTVTLAKANIDAVDITTEVVPHQVGLAITVDVADEGPVTAPALLQL